MRLGSFIFLCVGLTVSVAGYAQTGVMARAVPERKDDFVFENDKICYRIYGRALEPKPTSPGIDVWVKLPGRLVADEWYAAAVDNPGYYHHDHGGKDCYETARSLGAGASSPLVNGVLAYPATNYRSYEIVQSTPLRIVFTLHYPEWEYEGIVFALDKTFTVESGERFVQVDDLWHVSGAQTGVDVMAGLFLHPSKHTVECQMSERDVVAVWEHASDTKSEPEDGMIGLAIVMPASSVSKTLPSGSHLGCVCHVRDGEHVRYYISSVWSKCEISSSREWMRYVRSFRRKVCR